MFTMLFSLSLLGFSFLFPLAFAVFALLLRSFSVACFMLTFAQSILQRIYLTSFNVVALSPFLRMNFHVRSGMRFTMRTFLMTSSSVIAVAPFLRYISPVLMTATLSHHSVVVRLVGCGVSTRWIFFLLDTTHLAQSLGQKKTRYST